MHNCTISRNHSKYTIIWTKIVQTKVVKYCTIGPDCLESTILKITGKISVVIYSLLSLDNSLLCWKIVTYKSK